jgi:hypothetical protein
MSCGKYLTVKNGRFVGVVGSRSKADTASDYVCLDRGTLLLHKHANNGKYRLALVGRGSHLDEHQPEIVIPLAMVSHATQKCIHSSGKNKKHEKMSLGKVVLYLNAQVDTKREGLEKFTFKFNRDDYYQFCDTFQKAMTENMDMMQQQA